MDTNKNNHTTSTKCQYKIPASNPRWWLFVSVFMSLAFAYKNNALGWADVYY